jgi:outer membrane protein OmpA-like peptidoglycan-associated protein
MRIRAVSVHHRVIQVVGILAMCAVGAPSVAAQPAPPPDRAKLVAESLIVAARATAYRGICRSDNDSKGHLASGDSVFECIGGDIPRPAIDRMRVLGLGVLAVRTRAPNDNATHLHLATGAQLTYLPSWARGYITSSIEFTDARLDSIRTGNSSRFSTVDIGVGTQTPLIKRYVSLALTNRLAYTLINDRWNTLFGLVGGAAFRVPTTDAAFVKLEAGVDANKSWSRVNRSVRTGLVYLFKRSTIRADSMYQRDVAVMTHVVTYLQTDTVRFADTVRVTERVALDTISLPVYFDFAKASLTTATQDVIQTTVLPLLARSPSATVYIDAHADPCGGDDINDPLSTERGVAVQSYLKRNGVDVRRIVVVAEGSRMPNAHADLRAADKLPLRCGPGVRVDRRVRLTIVMQGDRASSRPGDRRRDD